MIVNFSVQNFGAIKDKVTLSFEADSSDELENYYIIEPKKGVRLLKLGLIYGANASGKTTILKALDFLRKLILNPLEKKTEELEFTPFLFQEKIGNTFFELEFFNQEKKYLYEIELNKKAIIKEKLYFYNPNKALVFERSTDEKKQFTSIKFGSKIKISKEYKTVLEANTLWNNTVFGGFSKTNFESLELQEVLDWFEKTLRNIIFSNTNLYNIISSRIENGDINKDILLRFLKKADFKINNLSFLKEKLEMNENLRKAIRETFNFSNEEMNNLIEDGKLIVNTGELLFEHYIDDNNQQKKYDLLYAQESQGTQRYYQFAGVLALMMRKEGGIFPIDEIESSLHADLLRHFLLTFLVNTKNAQLIATTHHRELLMEKDILRNDVIWFTEKKEDGSTDLYSLADFDSSVIRNTSSVYNAYKIGKLGALPNLDDYYIDTDN